MDVNIEHRPAYALARVTLEGNEEVQAEGGAMVSMSKGMTIETGTGGADILKSLARSFLGGESFFVNTFKAPAGGGQITFAPALPGDMQTLTLDGDTLLVQSGGYVASSMGIEVEAGWGGPKTFFASEGLVLLRAKGSGTLVLSSYGAIVEQTLAAGESMTVDTGHLVAFSENIGFEVRQIGGLRSTLFSGEGLVVDLTGPGRILMQTRSQDDFLSWLIPRLPSDSSSS